jgi:hypothetical protein
MLYLSVYSRNRIRIRRSCRLRKSCRISPPLIAISANSSTINTSKIFSIFCISLIIKDFKSTRINTSGNKDLKSPRINTSGSKDLKSFRINTSKKHGRGEGSARFSPALSDCAPRGSSLAEILGNYHHRSLSCYHSRAAQNRTAQLERRFVNTEFPRSAKKGISDA